MIPYAARSFTDPAGFMNSAFPRISQPVSSDRRRSRINGVFPTYPSTPKAFGVDAQYFAVIRSESLWKLLSHVALFDSHFLCGAAILGFPIIASARGNRWRRRALTPLSR